jgi:septal ring factor EnvC (AmiA/AmiB activator)
LTDRPNDEAVRQLKQTQEQLEEVTRDRDEGRSQLAAVEAELEACKQQPADLLNQLKRRRKKSKADLADVEVLLDLLCDGCDR